jgi:hypothetical protein
MSERPRASILDFSLVIGGPLYRMLRRAHLDGSDHELLWRRVALAIVITWLPLLILSLWDGNAWNGTLVPFARDIDTHVRFLVVVPLLFVAEIVLHGRVGQAVRKFQERELIPDGKSAQADAVVATAVRWLDSVWVELLLIVFVYTVGVNGVWRHVSALEVETWYGAFAHGLRIPSVAGWWLGWVSIPVLQFLVLRWYFRLLVWWRLLWQVSRMDLDLQPLHPDRCGGLGFLGHLSVAFSPFLLAEGALMAGQIADQIFFAGKTLPQFKIELAAVTVVAVLVILGPLMMFAPGLAQAKRRGLAEYGTLGTQYARDFHRKWLSGKRTDETLVGSADLQSLADLGNSYETLSEMRIVPFKLSTALQLAAAVLLPIAPLLLTMISLEELLSQMVKVLF